MPCKLKHDSAPKTGYGNGSVYEEKRGSGHWIAVLNGVRRRAKSQEEGLEKLRILQERRDRRLKLKKGSLTVLEWTYMWLDRYCDDLNPKTLEGYRDVVRCHIEPYAIARVRLEELTTDDIREWLAALRRKTFIKGKKAKPKRISSSTVAIALRRLQRALEIARLNDILIKNPAELSASRPAKRSASMSFLSQSRLCSFWSPGLVDACTRSMPYLSQSAYGVVKC